MPLIASQPVHRCLRLFALLLTLFAATLPALAADEDFLPARSAYKVATSAEPDNLVVRCRHLVCRARGQEVFVRGQRGKRGGEKRQQQREQAQAPEDRQGGDQWHEVVGPSGGVGANANDTWTGSSGRCSPSLRESVQESIAIVFRGGEPAS